MKNKKIISIAILVFVILLIGVSYQQSQVIKVSYTTFNQMLEEGKIETVFLSEQSSMSFEVVGESAKYQTDNPRVEGFKETLLLQEVSVIETQELLGIVQYMTAIVVVGVISFAVIKAMKNSKQKAMAFNKGVMKQSELTVGFEQIAGNIEAKEQVQDFIAFIKEPERFIKLGAKMPKGVLFYGPPGTGKTLMAKAIAKEAGVPFFSVSGSDFMQMYVGVGASRIRELFKEASSHKKAVIFIDEIDAIGKKRSMQGGGNSDEKDQTLNALLTEMSGFKGEDGIIVVAATNRLDVLDDALLRPGRFDRHVEIGYPDKSARIQIISHYLNHKKVSDDIDVEELGKQTVYFTGAMIENLLNEAAIIAVNQGAHSINTQHIDQAFYTVIAGSEKKDKSGVSDKDRKITAYHEAGHALVTKLLLPSHTVSKVTIIPSTKGAGGFSMNIPKDAMYMTKKELIYQMQVTLAGRAAEEIVFGEDAITTGASNDIEKVSKYMKDYMTKYGMDKEVGLVNQEVLLASGHVVEPIAIEKYSTKIEAVYNNTKQILLENRQMLDRLATELIVKETLKEKDIDQIISA